MFAGAEILRGFGHALTAIALSVAPGQRGGGGATQVLLGPVGKPDLLVGPFKFRVRGVGTAKR